MRRPELKIDFTAITAWMAGEADEPTRAAIAKQLEDPTSEVSRHLAWQAGQYKFPTASKPLFVSRLIGYCFKIATYVILIPILVLASLPLLALLAFPWILPFSFYIEARRTLAQLWHRPPHPSNDAFVDHARKPPPS